LADLGFTTDSSPFFFFFLLYFRQLPAELAEWNSAKTGHVLGSKCDLKIHVQNLRYLLPLQIGGSKTTFWSTSKLDGNFNGLYLWIETRYWTIGQVHCKLQGVSYNVSKQRGLWSTNGFKFDSHFYPPDVNSAFCFIARLRRWRLANGTQPHFAKRYIVLTICRRKFGVISPKKLGAKKLLHLFIF